MILIDSQMTLWHDADYLDQRPVICHWQHRRYLRYVHSFLLSFIVLPHSMMNSVDDESYTSYRCRHHLLITIHAFLTCFTVAHLRRRYLATAANSLRQWIVSGYTTMMWRWPSETVGVCHAASPSCPHFHDETTQHKRQAYVRACVLLAKTRHVRTDPSPASYRRLQPQVSPRCWWILDRTISNWTNYRNATGSQNESHVSYQSFPGICSPPSMMIYFILSRRST